MGNDTGVKSVISGHMAFTPRSGSSGYRASPGNPQKTVYLKIGRAIIYFRKRVLLNLPRMNLLGTLQRMNLPRVSEANVYRPGLHRSLTLSHGCGGLQILKDLRACQ